MLAKASGADYDTVWSTPSGAAAVQRVEIDFGANPERSAIFTVTDALVTPTTRVCAWESAETATGRVGVDQEWDQLFLAARAGSGSFDLYVTAHPGPVAGRRVIYYQRG